MDLEGKFRFAEDEKTVRGGNLQACGPGRHRGRSSTVPDDTRTCCNTSCSRPQYVPRACSGGCDRGGGSASGSGTTIQPPAD